MVLCVFCFHVLARWQHVVDKECVCVYSSVTCVLAPSVSVLDDVSACMCVAGHVSVCPVGPSSAFSAGVYCLFGKW